MHTQNSVLMAYKASLQQWKIVQQLCIMLQPNIKRSVSWL